MKKRKIRSDEADSSESSSISNRRFFLLIFEFFIVPCFYLNIVMYTFSVYSIFAKWQKNIRIVNEN